MIKASVMYLISKGLIVFYDAEHFFDGYKENRDYALRCLKSALKAGAKRLILCDTNGGTLPAEVLGIVKDVYEFFKKNERDYYLGVHFHDDNGCAVANSVLVTDYITQIQGTINGFGERTGNADLCQIIPSLILKKKINLPKIKLNQLKQISDMIYTLSNNKPENNQPYVGDFAFSHKGGVHVDAINKGASYEHVDPGLVGNKRNIVLSDLSGKANIVEVAKSFGLEIDKNHPNIKEMLDDVETLEKKGYEIGSIEAERFLLIQRYFSDNYVPININHWKVMSENRKGEFSESVVVGNIEGCLYEVVAHVEGAGPVGAIYKALQKLVSGVYPEISRVRLVNYKVRIAEDKGADSSVRVYVEFKDDEGLFGTVGVSANIFEASLEAIKKGFEYILLKKKVNNL
jgi:2-isopropylmalate synthase